MRYINAVNWSDVNRKINLILWHRECEIIHSCELLWRKHRREEDTWRFDSVGVKFSPTVNCSGVNIEKQTWQIHSMGVKNFKPVNWSGLNKITNLILSHCRCESIHRHVVLCFNSLLSLPNWHPNHRFQSRHGLIYKICI